MKLENPLNQANSIEKQFFETICLLLVVVMGYVGLQSYLNLGVTKMLLLDVSLVLLGLGFYYLSAYQSLFNQLRYLFIVLLLSSCSVFWFWLHGLYGSTPYALISGMVISIFISEAKYRRWVLGFSVTIVLSLVLIQLNTNWIVKDRYSSELLANNFVIFSLATIFMLYYLKSRYDLEKRHVSDQNQTLTDLNGKLNITVKEKDEIISQLKKTREQLLESEKMASVGKLTAGIAHELNNPLNYIGGVVTPLKKDIQELLELVPKDNGTHAEELRHEIRELMKTLESGTKKASDVVKSLVTLSPEQVSSVKETFSLGTVLLEQAALLRKTHEEIHFKTDLVDQELMVEGNPLELSKVCHNLLQNSIMALEGSPQKEVFIEIRKMDKSLVLEVTDQGEGIKKEHMKQVFDPFFSTRETGKGAGLGMYMCYSIIKKHYGQIRVESEENKGTTVSIFLPLAG